MTEYTATILAGETSIEAAHGLSVTPEITDFSIIAIDDLGGRSWLAECDATNLTITISSADELANHSFKWKPLYEEYAPAAGRYGVLNTVKNLCGIDLSESSFDTQFDASIQAADDFIDLALQRCSVTVPLTVVPDMIVHISNYLAAGLYKQKDIPDEKVHSFYTVGINLLNEYLMTNYPGYPGVGVEPPKTNLAFAYGVGKAV